MIKLNHNSIQHNPKLGHYSINGKIFVDKMSALLEASKAGLKYDNVKWHFNDEVFSKVNWQIEPPGDIRTYYQHRARQIREKYDYLILNFSGGSDSTTVLYSFIQAGLFIDEVVIRNPVAATKKYGNDRYNLNPQNEFSEFEFAAKPILKWLERVSPKTKITVEDFSLDLVQDNITWDENFIHWTGDYINPGCIVRYANNRNLDHLRKFDQGKKVAIIFGTDKPRIICQDDDVNFYFFDRATHSPLPARINNDFDNVEIELFFWSPELPELIVKQCHMVKQWFEHPANKRLVYMMNYWWQTTAANRGAYESCIKGIIYPDYDLSTWQVNKTTISGVLTEWDFYMQDFKETSAYKTFMRGVEYVYNNVDKDFFTIAEPFKTPGAEFNLYNWELRPCLSKMYNIGKLIK